MSDNLRRYRARRDALTQGYPGEPTGNRARHVTTLAALISGIVASKSTQLPKIATQVPDGTKPESRDQTMCPMAAQRPHQRGGVFFTVCGHRIGAIGLADLGVRDRWQCWWLWRHRVDDPRGL